MGLESQCNDGLASSDYRLSPFGKKVSVENPRLVRYWSLQVRLGYSF